MMTYVKLFVYSKNSMKRAILRLPICWKDILLPHMAPNTLQLHTGYLSLRTWVGPEELCASPVVMGRAGSTGRASRAALPISLTNPSTEQLQTSLGTAVLRAEKKMAFQPTSPHPFQESYFKPEEYNTTDLTYQIPSGLSHFIEEQLKFREETSLF